jgi:hypothetical protein
VDQALIESVHPGMLGRLVERDAGEQCPDCGETIEGDGSCGCDTDES